MGARSLGGRWTGTYSYPAGAGPTTPFVAWVDETAGRLAGTTSEPGIAGIAEETLTATIVGFRDGHAVDFVKTYDSVELAGDPVDYVGRVSEGGNLITGVWSLLDMDGRFEMRRESAEEEPEALREKASAGAG